MTQRMDQIEIRVQGDDDFRRTTVTRSNRVLLDYITPEVSGAEASHWRAVLERLSFFSVEADAREAGVAKVQEESLAAKTDEMVAELRERFDNERHQLANQFSMIVALREQVRALQAEKAEAASRRGVRKQPAKKQARKRP